MCLVVVGTSLAPLMVGKTCPAPCWLVLLGWYRIPRTAAQTLRFFSRSYIQSGEAKPMVTRPQIEKLSARTRRMSKSESASIKSALRLKGLGKS